MRTLAIGGFALLTAFALSASPALAQDYDAMAKWTDAKVLRFHASGDFNGQMSVLVGSKGYGAKITDHVEFDFDWDNVEMKVIGKPMIKNFPMKVVSYIPLSSMPFFASCPDPKVEGAAEYWTLQSVTNSSAMVTLQAKQDTAPGTVPVGDIDSHTKCGTTWEKVTATSRTVETKFQLPHAMMLEMAPEMLGDLAKVSKDRKSFIISTDGWVLTLTPTIVK